jgi:hypothetical protein
MMAALRTLTLTALVLTWACSSDGTGRKLRVGEEASDRPGGSAGIGSGAGQVDGGNTSAGNGSLGVRVQDIGEMTLEVITLACAGDCADVEAVAHGGNPPYTFEWEDGSTSPFRRVCLDSTAALQVSATDTAVSDEEFEYVAQTSTTEVPATVLDCGDGGTCVPGPGPMTPVAGHYEGTGDYTCDNDMDPGTAMTINKLKLIIDIEIDESADVQRGHAYFQWGLAVIVAEGDLEGTLGCGGLLQTSYVDAVWGIPGAEPMSVVPTGKVTADFVIRRGAADPNVISGSFEWVSHMFDGSYGNTCNVTYEATVVP